MRRGTRPAAAILGAILIAAAAGHGEDAIPAAAAEAARAAAEAAGFQPGDISIGDPIALPFTPPKAAAAAPAAPAAPAGEPRSILAGSPGSAAPATVAASTPAAAAAPAALTDAAPPLGRGWLGMTVAESTVPGRWTVDQIAPAGPAAAAGLVTGDEVRAINGQPLRNADEVSELLTAIAPGQRVNVAVARNEQLSDVVVMATERPAPAAARTWQASPADQAAPAANAPPAFAAAPPTFRSEPLAQLPAQPQAAPAQPQFNPVQPQAARTQPQFNPAQPQAASAPPQAASAPPQAASAPPQAASAPPPAAAPRFSSPPVAAAAPPAAAFTPAPAVPADVLPPPAAFGAAPAAASAGSSPPSLVPAPGGRTALGVRTVPIDAGLQARFNLPEASGAYVIGVVQDLPASRAGVPPGSVIVALGDRPVRSPDELTQLLTAGPVGRPVPIQYVLPGGTPRRAEVVLQALERPLEEALTGPAVPTSIPVPTLEPGPSPTTARRPISPRLAADVEALEAEVRDLRARLERLERQLPAGR
jgi:membrane-associated protease RseP (regulator of RpoE activity)